MTLGYRSRIGRLNNDSLPDSADNCPVVANNDQLNTDGDSQGDLCDSDDDNDGVLDGTDVCPSTPAATVVAPSNGCSVAHSATHFSDRLTVLPLRAGLDTGLLGGISARRAGIEAARHGDATAGHARPPGLGGQGVVAGAVPHRAGLA